MVSSTRITLSAVGRTVSTKNRSHSKTTGPFIQPLSEQVPCVDGGAPSKSRKFILFRAKIMNGGTKNPAALQQQITVVVLPLSVLAIIPTCRFPTYVNTFGVLLEDDWIPFSSMLYNRVASISCFSICSSNKSKNL